jgi:hypothetical protein
MVPEEARKIPEMVFRVVLFPAPFEPIIETISPSLIIKETPRKA